MNETRITVHGNVVSDPVERQGRNGSIFTTFRVATTPYRRTADGRFVDLDTSFYSVIAFNVLAANVAASLRKGQPVVVEGNVAIKQYVGSDGQGRTSAEIDADHIGHDLTWGRAAFERVSKAAALGHDRTSDPEVRRSMEAMADGDAGRPANVDADGVVSDDPTATPESVAGSADARPDGPADASDEADVTALGDPETRPYEVDDRLSA
jgi:single-strand DNA-binding protein